MKSDPKGITTAMHLYFSGESLRNTAKSLRLLGMEVSHQTIYNWIKKYIKLMQTYLDRIVPEVGDEDPLTVGILETLGFAEPLGTAVADVRRAIEGGGQVVQVAVGIEVHEL